MAGGELKRKIKRNQKEELKKISDEERERK